MFTNKVFKVPFIFSARKYCKSKSTIFALSSGRGKCGVSVIRVSGPDASTALKFLTASKSMPEPRRAYLKNIKYPNSKEVIDQGLTLWFPGPKSFTGEDCCEFQVHGSLAVVSAMMRALGSIDNLRPAEPGEFTKRAFYNSKLDLTEIEGLGDLLEAETEVQRKQAFLQYQGALSKKYERWRGVLLSLLASIEASIDFEETEDIEERSWEKEVGEVRKLRSDILDHLNDGRRGERLRNGVRTVILGEPNVGKSSLLNILCQRPAAIVSEYEGTTRDVVEVTQDIGGYPIIVSDTAGLRSETRDVLELEGMNRARLAYHIADLILLVIDATKYSEYRIKNPQHSLKDYIETYIRTLGLPEILEESEQHLPSIHNGRIIPIINKIDVVNLYIDRNNDGNCQDDFTKDFIKISCKSEQGIKSLVKKLEDKLKIICGEPTAENPSMNQIRHRKHLERAVVKMDEYLEMVKRPMKDEVILAELIRQAAKQISYITGKITTEDVLDVLFSNFCIGK